MQGYETMHGMFPPSELESVRGGGWSTNRVSGFAFLLPHLELVPLYDAINMSFAHIDGPDYPILENRTARRTVVASFLCPSDGVKDCRISYRFNHGRLVSGRPLPFDGPFGIGVTPSAAAIRDGLTRTAFVSERIGGSFVAGSAQPARDVKFPAASPQPLLSDEEFIPYCLAAPAAQWEVKSGRYWLYNDIIDTGYNHNGTPNDRRPTCSGAVWKGSGFHPPRSHHPGRVNVLFGDGHVEAVADSIAPGVWSALGTYDAGD